ncbi:LytTR family transcriptional regulator DNA-binding domain-containing protein [Staphylococcus pseudoxylosus]|uniref:LytR/AlgR family response regulator transcription factor n=1 Tax=Staphylococcus pseudoxylosus TaxID=2282419 RepID=UPI000D1D4523|nr:LytTR family transcriptional regulator DNA-binding domain-containing protein [Staphylococcus pseudoxylosus]PTI45262.1 ABC transporter ATP-binding protein [Staphylococcus xylosus]MDW8797253.1 LytTR family transcriptional regulator DNA-binding domain-containing protein [Staphylococcus pseudoxylosus]MEB6036281.1 LytTR family transcriptional regulator DNA-binding domain-containing protein [Staphylococcus pseudoxylosus]MEB6061041.1 LytTR family transcriptional regulator DNA-binding domain-contain
MVNHVKLFISPNKTVELKANLTTIITENEFQDTIINSNHEHNNFKTYTLMEPLPERMTVIEVIKFWCKWYDADINQETILYKFNLNVSNHKKIKKLTISELKLLHIVKLMLMPESRIIIKEPLQNITIETKHTIINLLNELSHSNTIITLTNHTEEALLVSKYCYRLNKNAFKPVELSNDEYEDNAPPQTETQNHLSRQQIRRLTVKTNEKVMFLDPIDIDYLEGQDGKVMIHVGNEQYIHDTTLQNIEKLIIPYGFYRCHRSYIINLQKVSEIISWSKNSYSIRLNTSKDTLIPLSRQKASDIEQFFNIH